MDEGKQFSLRWDNHAVNLASEAECFFQDEAFLDCTLFAEGQYLQAHKLILSAASPYLANLLRASQDKHPILIFNDIKFDEIKGIVSFIYNGWVSVPETNMGAFLHAAQVLLVRGLTQASKTWETENNESKRQLSQRPGKRSSTKPRSCEDRSSVGQSPATYPPNDSSKLHEVSMSSYLPIPRRYSKPPNNTMPSAVNSNFVMSTWKLGSAEEKNGPKKPTDDTTDAPPAHMFKKFRLEKPPPAQVEDEKVVSVKQEIEDDLEEEMTEDDPDGDSREAFYNPPEEAPVPLLVCKTSLHEEQEGGTWSNTSPEHMTMEPGQELPCHRCHKKYKSRYALNRHVLYECGKARKSFSCDECGKKVTRQDTLQKHKLIHLVQHMKEKDTA